jgi:putative transposase
MDEAKERIGCFLEEVYNRKGLHAALGCEPPAGFEQSVLSRQRVAQPPPEHLLGE